MASNESGDEDEWDPIRTLITDRARELKLTMAEISRAIGRNPAYMHQFTTQRRDGKPRQAKLPEDPLSPLAKVLRLPIEQLRPASVTERMRAYAEPPAPQSGLSSPGAPAPLDVPIYPDQGEIAPGAVTEWTTRPDRLAAVAGVWAVAVASYRGRLRAGDLAYVRPSQAARPGDAVIVLRGQQIAAIGDLIGQEGDKIVIRENGGETELVRAGLRVVKIALIECA
jgi:hypothetical protein